jgi:hypothetical protein
MSDIIEQKIELSVIPYACFSVELHEVTKGAIDRALEKAFCEFLANPDYLFCSKHDHEKIDAEIDRCTNYRVHPGWIRTPGFRWMNETTGRLMHIVILPDIEDGRLLFGFMTY